MMKIKAAALAAATMFCGLSVPALAEPIQSPSDANIKPSVDIVGAAIAGGKVYAVFSMQTASKPGQNKPAALGSLEGAGVAAYVWPVSLDPASVGFEEKSGILALAVTAHPDFDDTPLFDENADRDRDNDGALWHTHWVVLAKDAACGGGLKVGDIAEGSSPKLPRTWPGLPLLIDSPGYSPRLSYKKVEVRVPFDDLAAIKGQSFDAVTAALAVSADLKAPLLCVTGVSDIASGDLSLPGKIE